VSFQEAFPNALLLAEQEETQFILPKVPADLFYPISLAAEPEY
jgi:hypothetical protein